MAQRDERPLAVQITDTGDGPVFDRFFAGYDRAFVLPDEKEDVEGFRACLALNHGAEHDRLVAEYGPFRELCLVADDADGTPAGGANMIAAVIDVPGFGPAVTVNLNYVYVDPASRGRGHLRRLVAASAKIAESLFGDPIAPIVFIEQNDPFRMSAQAYARDTAATGLDQLDRLRIWSRLGARIVDIDYVQPALSAGQGPDDTLIYSVLGRAEPTLPAAILRAHLARFFGISVLKGAPFGGDETVQAQLNDLGTATAANRRIDLLDPEPLLDRLAAPQEARALLGEIPPSFRAALHIFRGADGAPRP